MPSPGVDEEKRETLRRFAAFGSIPLAGLTREDPPDNASLTRDAIRGYLAETPGAHFSKLRDDLQLGTGEAQHHLNHLIESNTVDSHRDGDYRRFYPADRFTHREKRLLGYLRRPTTRRFLIALLRDPTASPTTIADRIDVSKATVSSWATRLADDDLLHRDDGYILDDPETVLMFVVRFADSFDDDAVALASEAQSLIDYNP